MTHLTELVDLFETIKTNHSLINGFGFGALSETDADKLTSLEYPLLWVAPPTLTADRGRAVMEFPVLVADIPAEDESDRLDIWSDTQQIIMDVVNEFRHSESAVSQSSYHLDGLSVTVDLFEERFGNVLAGAETIIGIVIPSDNNLCLKP